MVFQNADIHLQEHTVTQPRKLWFEQTLLQKPQNIYPLIQISNIRFIDICEIVSVMWWETNKRTQPPFASLCSFHAKRETSTGTIGYVPQISQEIWNISCLAIKHTPEPFDTVWVTGCAWGFSTPYVQWCSALRRSFARDQGAPGSSSLQADSSHRAGHSAAQSHRTAGSWRTLSHRYLWNSCHSACWSPATGVTQLYADQTSKKHTAITK